MLKLGEKSISKLCIKDKKISKAYLGSKLIFEDGGSPIFVEYLQSDGNQYIDTGVFPDNTYTFDSTIAITENNYNCVFWGVRSESTYESLNSQCYLNSNSNNAGDDGKKIKLYSTNTFNSKNWNSGVIPVIYEKYIFTGMTVVATMNPMIYPITLFALNNIGNINTSNGMCRIYGWTAYSNGKTVMDLRPCLNPKTLEPCMYDLVSKQYFYNQGTGEFKTGKVLDSYLDYVVFDGASYIDTGVVPVFGDEFEIEFTTQYSSQECVFNAGTGDYQFIAVQNPQFYYKYFETGGARGVSMSLFPQELTLCKFLSDGSIIVNNKVVVYPLTTLTPQTVNTNLFIGARANKTIFFRGSIGKCKLTGADGTVKLNLQPCIDKDGVACFYDTVSKRYLYNQGTGNLTII